MKIFYKDEAEFKATNRMVFYEQKKTLFLLRESQDDARKRFKVRDLAVFGSVVRNEQTGASDIDILADFEDDATLFDFVGWGLFLEEKLGRKVDVVPQRSIRKELREQVIREMVKV
jgi:predicted nucleotidyltransferase